MLLHVWRPCLSCVTKNWRFKVHTSVCLSSSSLYPLHIMFIIMAEDIQNLVILYQIFINDSEKADQLII